MVHAPRGATHTLELGLSVSAVSLHYPYSLLQQLGNSDFDYMEMSKEIFEVFFGL